MSTSNEFSYYLIYKTRTANSPSVELDEDENGADLRRVKKPIACELVKMCFIEPFPKKPEMLDFHGDGAISVFTEKIYAALAPLSIKGVQLVKGVIKDPRSKKSYDGYYYLHIHSYISCLNKELSEYKSNEKTGMVLSISKMVLDEAVLSKIPLEERLIFRLGEYNSFQLVHESIVEKIQATNPTGVRFVKVEDYHFGSAFS